MLRRGCFGAVSAGAHGATASNGFLENDVIESPDACVGVSLLSTVWPSFTLR